MRAAEAIITTHQSSIEIVSESMVPVNFWGREIVGY